MKELLKRNDIAYVVNACDAGREGELIFKRVYDLSGSQMPVKRLWISSLEDSAIEKGFTELRPASEYENLANAAVCWLIAAIKSLISEKLSISMKKSKSSIMK